MTTIALSTYLFEMPDERHLTTLCLSKPRVMPRRFLLKQPALREPETGEPALMKSDDAARNRSCQAIFGGEQT